VEIVVCSCLMVGAALGAHPAPWHLDGWTCRAVVTIPEPLADRSVDTAAVRVLCQGQAQAAGNDYRVVDAAGQRVQFQLMFHDAERYSLIAFRATDVGQTYYIYFGNPAAERAAEQVISDPKPGAGPPSGVWVPRYGLVYTTLRRPEGDNPKTVTDLAAMLAASPAQDGARFQRQISDGFNPFGSSDNYMSVYRGWIEIPAAGRYRFCTASNEASFSFLDGKELIHWPGRHTEERGIHGEKNAAVELSAGRHYIEYYHEEVALQQMAFLGWSPPYAQPTDKNAAAMEPFSGIPESVFVAPHQALVARYEAPNAAAPRFEPAIVDTIWPELRHEGQYTRCRFVVNPAGRLGDAATYRWDFGDGQSAAGAEVEHVYLVVGTYTVKCTVEPEGGTAKWPLVVYEVQHVTEQIREGNSAEYVKMVSGYDRTRLDAAALKELAHLLAESGDPKAAIEVGGEFTARFAGEKPDWLPGVRRLMADCALQLGGAQADGGPLDIAKLDEAIANYLASLTDATPPAERFDVLTRLVKLLGIDRDAPEKALEIYAQAEEAAKGKRLDEAGLIAYRKTIIAAGDVRLWHAEPERARTLYRKAEALTARPIAAQVRSAQLGAYPNLIREFTETGDFGAALDVVDRWENAFPTEKLAGQTFFWRGKLLALRGQHQYAARHLARAVGLAVGAGFESEARWLLAQSLRELGRADDARRELAKLVAAGFGDDFAERAKKQLSEGK